MTKFTPPPIEDRQDGLELLAIHRGKWMHVRWVKEHDGWSLGYGAAFIRDGSRQFAPLPDSNEADLSFYGGRS